jgi:hypothetical protein
MKQNYLDQYILDRVAVRVIYGRCSELRQHEFPHVIIGKRPQKEIWRDIYEQHTPGVWVHTLWLKAGGTVPTLHEEPPLAWIIVQDPKRRNLLSKCSRIPKQYPYYVPEDFVDIRFIGPDCILYRIVTPGDYKQMIGRYFNIIYAPSTSLECASDPGRLYFEREINHYNTLAELTWLCPALRGDHSVSFIEQLKIDQNYLLYEDGAITCRGRLLLQIEKHT